MCFLVNFFFLQKIHTICLFIKYLNFKLKFHYSISKNASYKSACEYWVNGHLLQSHNRKLKNNLKTAQKPTHSLQWLAALQEGGGVFKVTAVGFTSNQPSSTGNRRYLSLSVLHLLQSEFKVITLSLSLCLPRVLLIRISKILIIPFNSFF